VNPNESRGDTVSEKITNSFKFYGNQAVLALENEIARRLHADRISDNDPDTAVQRILFGLSSSESFDSFVMTGADCSWYFGDGDKFELESKQCSLEALQDHITRCAATIDPLIVVQMDFIGNTPQLIGTRFTGFDSQNGVISACCEEEMNYTFCDESDVDDLLEEFEEDGRDISSIMSFQELDERIAQLRENAHQEFINYSGREYFHLR
jgi:hypothetical protein